MKKIRRVFAENMQERRKNSDVYKRQELDFVIEYKGNVLPIEVKSGKSYTRHNALDNVMSTPRYHIEQAIVFCNENIHEKNRCV